MKLSTLASTALVMACLIADAHAQAPQSAPAAVPPSPQLSQEEMQRRLSAASASLAPLVAKTSEELAEAQLRIAERPETTERIATFKKNLFEALRRKGFTAEQALQLTASTSVAPFNSR